jgi:hypothetical protein
MLGPARPICNRERNAAGSIDRHDRTRDLRSSNGDVWLLARDPASQMPAVRHRPNVGSGGRSSYTEIGKFLRNGASGPEHQALLQLIGTLLDG